MGRQRAETTLVFHWDLYLVKGEIVLHEIIAHTTYSGNDGNAGKWKD